MSGKRFRSLTVKLLVPGSLARRLKPGLHMPVKANLKKPGLLAIDWEGLANALQSELDIKYSSIDESIILEVESTVAEIKKWDGPLEEIEQINKDIPQINLVPIIDSSDYVSRSINTVGSTAMYGGFFAVLVLLFFLRNMRSTAIVAAAIPISIIATFIARTSSWMRGMEVRISSGIF